MSNSRGPASVAALVAEFGPTHGPRPRLRKLRSPNSTPRRSGRPRLSMALPDCATGTRPRDRTRSVVARWVSATGEGTSDCAVTLSHVSSRIGSEFGTLGERLAAMKPKPAERPVDPARHVWVQTPSGRQAGLLVAWVTGVDGTWWGRVAVSDAPGEASLQLLAGRLLSPVQQEAEEPEVRADQPG